MGFKYAMDDGDVRAGNLVDGDVAGMIALVDGICEEEEVTAVKGWFHGSAVRTRFSWITDAALAGYAPKNNNNWRLRVCY